jgi:hypothetical protein
LVKVSQNLHSPIQDNKKYLLKQYTQLKNND